MKKILAFALAALMLLAVLASCTPAGTGDDTDGVTDTVVVTDKWGQASVSHEVPDELDYQGMEIGFACRPETRYRREISVETQEDPLDMQIFLRNQQAENYLGTKLKFIEASALWGEPSSNIVNFVKAEAQSGAQSNVDVIFAYAAYTVAPDMRPYLVNLNGDDLPYLNINKAYWNQSYVDAATCYDQLYYIVGDLTLTIYDKAMVTFVNLDKASEAGVTADSLYQAVHNKQWTMNYYTELVINYPYMDINNNNEVDAGDQIRVTTISQSEGCDGYYAAFDLKLLTENENGSHTINVDGNTKLENGAKMVYNVYSQQGLFFENKVSTPWKLFINGYSLFHIDILYRSAAQNQEMRSAKFNYGILPLPMYDENQADVGYFTTSQDAYNAISVLKTHPEKFEAISAFLEVLASKSYDDVRPFYIEKMVKGEYAADADSVQMIEYIMDGISFETGWLYSFQVDRFAYNVWRSCCWNNKSTVEKWGEISDKATQAVRTFDMWFEGTRDM